MADMLIQSIQATSGCRTAVLWILTKSYRSLHTIPATASLLEH